MKICARCKIQKDLSQFGKRKNGTARPYCHPCKAALSRLERASWTPEQRKHHTQYKAKYNQENLTAFRKWTKKCYENQKKLLSDNYIKNIFKDWGTPQVLVDIKREQIKLVREIRKNKHEDGVNEKR